MSIESPIPSKLSPTRYSPVRVEDPLSDIASREMDDPLGAAQPLPPIEFSLFEILTPLVRRWRRVVLLPLALGAVALAGAIVLPSAYTARTTFTTDGSPLALPSSLGSLAGLATQFGVAGLGGGNTSPEFYAEVLKSHSILDPTLHATFPLSASGDSTVVLGELLGGDATDSLERMAQARRTLADRVSTQVDKTTGIVALEVTMESRHLAAGVANRMIELLNDFNLRRRQAQSSERRRFLEKQVEDARAELRAAESTRRRFLEGNRLYASSPLLSLEAARLDREVQLRQEVFTSLDRQFEEARIAERQDIPVTTVVDRAEPPSEPSFPRPLVMVVGAVLVGLLLATLSVYSQEYWRAARHSRSPEYEEFRRAFVGAIEEARSVSKRRAR
jgi:uncharacterized protein involved in exopolysaccharide biosynthesis